jgi:hypothetical protein
MSKIKDQIYNHVYDQVFIQTLKVYHIVGSVDNNTNIQLKVHVYDQVCTKIYLQIRNQIKQQLIQSR